jgi:ATP-dependent Clp protease ATP-binding subunit ClpA
MMERFTDDARLAVGHAVQHARRLGHRYVGPEHLLLAAASAAPPAGDILRAAGVTPDLVEEEMVRIMGLGAGASLFGGLDADALATIGIDLDAVRARIEASFGEQALERAARAQLMPPRRSRLSVLLHSAGRPLHRRRRAAPVRVPAPARRAATGRYRAPGPLLDGHIPFTPMARKVLEVSLREAVARHDQHIGVEHLVLSLTKMRRGLVPPILAAAGTSAPMLRAAVEDRYRRAG